MRDIYTQLKQIKGTGFVKDTHSLVNIMAGITAATVAIMAAITVAQNLILAAIAAAEDAILRVVQHIKTMLQRKDINYLNRNGRNQ